MEKFIDYLNRTRIGGISLSRLIYIVLILIVFLIAMKLILRIIRRALNKSELIEKGAQSMIIRGIKFLLYVTFAIAACGVIGVEISSFVALMSIVGAAMALAAQNILTNLFDGLILMFNHPFHIGDYIEAGDDGGTVVDTGLLYTRLCTPDNKVISIPNSQVFGDRIINYSTAEQRRVEILVPTSYTNDVEKVKAALHRAIQMTAGILPEGEATALPVVRLKEFGASSLNYTIRVWCKNSDYWSVYYDLMENIKQVYDEEGLSIPFNQLDVLLKQGSSNDAEKTK